MKRQSWTWTWRRGRSRTLRSVAVHRRKAPNTRKSQEMFLIFEELTVEVACAHRCEYTGMVSFVGILKLLRRARRVLLRRSRRVIRSQWVTRVDVGEPGRRLPHKAQCRIWRHHLCHHPATCKYPIGRVTPYVHLHFTPCDFNTFTFTKHFHNISL